MTFSCNPYPHISQGLVELKMETHCTPLSQSKMHWQAVAGNQKAVTLYIGQVRKQGVPALEYVHL